MRAIGVDEAAAVGAENLDGFLRGDGTLRDHLIGDGLGGGLAVRAGGLHGLRIQKLRGVVRPQVLNHALGDENQRNHQARGEQNPEHAARRIHPEIADGLRFLARDAANNGDGQRDADRRRNKVVIGEPGHLREIAHRRFAAVVLPVGVGGERSGGVEREMRLDAGEVLRIPGHPAESLNALDQVEHQHADAAEQQHRDGVFLPIHLVRCVDARAAIEQPLERPQNRIEKRLLARKHAGHKNAQRLGDRQQHDKKQNDLKPAVRSHGQNLSGHSSAASR